MPIKIKPQAKFMLFVKSGAAERGLFKFKCEEIYSGYAMKGI